MAIVKNPLFSVDAHGAIADALIYQTHKGQDVARAHFSPGQPQTPLQVTQREAVAAATLAWQLYLAPFAARDAWGRAVHTTHARMSGYHLAMRSLIPVIRDTADPCFAQQASSFISSSIEFLMINMITGSGSCESGIFDIYAGDSPTTMVLIQQTPVDFGCILTPALWALGDIVYTQIFKDGVARSGIFRTEIVSSQWTWTELLGAPVEPWNSITCSDDSQFVYAGYTNGGVYRSNDFGATWAEVDATPAQKVDDISCSSTGQNILTGVTSGTPRRSTDFGDTWDSVGGIPPAVWSAAVVSPDGTRGLIGRMGSRLYEINPFTGNAALATYLTNGNWRETMISGNNLVQCAVATNGFYAYTLDAGVIWTSTVVAIPGTVLSGAVSRDGVYFYGVANNEGLSYSSDRGASWTQNFDGIASGSHQAAFAGNTPVAILTHNATATYTTNDRGENFAVADDWLPDQPGGSTLTNTGSIGYVCLQNGRIWRGTQT